MPITSVQGFKGGAQPVSRERGILSFRPGSMSASASLYLVHCYFTTVNPGNNFHGQLFLLLVG